MRYLQKFIESDLKRKMVFMGGPRQVGKTTMAKELVKSKGLYLNWDSDRDKRRILKQDWSDDVGCLVFDELHKFPRWKNWLKGIYDTQTEYKKILVTGSARLDLYKKGGDSLLGRYHYYRLHPFSLCETPHKMRPEEVLKKLMLFGGFPEPFLQADEVEARRWRKDRFDRILKDDIRELEPIREIGSVALLVDLLRQRVGSPIVVSHLAMDLQVAPNTVKHWIDVLEKMYFVFKVPTYTKKISRSLQKPFKIYFYDNADVDGDEGARFENLIATHLLKKLNFLEDTKGHRCQLHYLRDKEGREVDFCITIDNQVVELIEAKLGDTAVAKSLLYYAERLSPQRATQILHAPTEKFKKNGLIVNNVLDEFRELKRWPF